MAVVKNVVPKKYKSEEERKQELKRVYVNIQRVMYLENRYASNKNNK